MHNVPATSLTTPFPQNQITKSLRKQLIKANACYVLITCSNPAEDGKMHVEMTYEGDTHLAAMILETAQEYIQEDQQNAAE